MPRSPARPTWTRGMPRCSPAQFAGAGSLHEVSWAARSAPPPAGVPQPSDLLLDGLAVLVTEGRVQAAPLLRRVARVFAEEAITTAERRRWSRVAVVAAVTVWDEQSWLAIQDRELQSCREAGLLAQLVIWVNSMATLTTWRGDFAAAASLIAEAEAIAAATGTLPPLRDRVARRIPRGRSRGRPADRGRNHGRPSCGTGCRHPIFAVDIRHPLQRARPLRESPGRRASRRAGA